MNTTNGGTHLPSTPVFIPLKLTVGIICFYYVIATVYGRCPHLPGLVYAPHPISPFVTAPQHEAFAAFLPVSRRGPSLFVRATEIRYDYGSPQRAPSFLLPPTLSCLCERQNKGMVLDGSILIELLTVDDRLTHLRRTSILVALTPSVCCLQPARACGRWKKMLGR